MEKIEYNIRNFFLFETQLPADSGFDLFGIYHFIWIFGIILFSVISGYCYQKRDRRDQLRIQKITGCILPAMEIYRDIILLVTGYFNAGFLPLHLCSIALWIAFFFSRTGNRFLGVIYILLCVPGAIGALLFPNWSVYPLFHYMNIHAFTAHGLTVVFGVWLFVSGEIVPEWKEIWIPLVFGLIGFVILYPLNDILDTNFWFLDIPAKDSPLVGIWELTGDKWYLVGYFLFCLGIVILWQGILKLVAFIFKNRKNITI